MSDNDYNEMSLDEILETGKKVLAKNRAELERERAAEEQTKWAEWAEAWQDRYAILQQFVPAAVWPYLKRDYPEDVHSLKMPQQNRLWQEFEIPGMAPIAAEITKLNRDDAEWQLSDNRGNVGIVVALVNQYWVALNEEERFYMPSYRWPQSSYESRFESWPMALAVAQERGKVFDARLQEINAKKRIIERGRPTRRIRKAWGRLQTAARLAWHRFKQGGPDRMYNSRTIGE